MSLPTPTALILILVTSAGAIPASELRADAGMPSNTPSKTTGLAKAVSKEADPVRRWNKIAIDATAIDHTPVLPGESRVYREQFAPTRASRAMAIVHIAMFEAVNAIYGGYRSYLGTSRIPKGASVEVAVAQAAHDTLVALFPAQENSLDGPLGEDLRRIPEGKARTSGADLGRRVAAEVLARRANDGSQQPEPRLGTDFVTSNEPGKWRVDPISHTAIAVGALWGEVTPFVLQSARQFRAPPPPDLGSEAYAAAFKEVRQLGGDGISTPTSRTEDQTLAGIYWAYDEVPSLCAPVRLYNQIVVRIADQMGSGLVETARLLAIVNVALADAAIAIWESKYHYQFWRPVTAIREAVAPSGPANGSNEGTSTIGDPSFVPLGTPGSNLSVVLVPPGGRKLLLTTKNHTPPFPSYPGGHAGFGGALFETLRKFYGTDQIAFTFVSDELNNVTTGTDGTVRPTCPRSFSSLSEAENENGQSRIYLGIHWAFDTTEGINQGRRVADFVFANLFQPARSSR